MDKDKILLEMEQDMLLFGRMVMPNMFSEYSPGFHYDIVNSLLGYEKQINIIAPVDMQSLPLQLVYIHYGI